MKDILSHRTTDPSPRVFISYLREDHVIIARLCEELELHQIPFWIDRANLAPGDNWAHAIRRAIHDGSYFLACFSPNYYRRDQTYQNEELTQAIDILRRYHTNRAWFIPIRLAPCQIPDRSIGGGETLQNLQRVDLFPDWNEGMRTLLSVIGPHKKKVLSEELTFLIAMFNEEGVIGSTIAQLISKKYDKRYDIIISDDASTDSSVLEARLVSESRTGISILENSLNGQKVGAISAALRNVRTPYVMLLDADSMVHELRPGALDEILSEMREARHVATGFKIRPRATCLVEKLQQIEYLIFTDSVRRLLGVIVCLVGQGVLWQTDTLKAILSQHSGIFEGDDLEATLLVALMEGRQSWITYESDRVIVTTSLKTSWSALLRQRIRIWDVGLLHSFIDTPKLLLARGRNATFLRSVFATDVLGHIFRILSLPPLLVLVFYALARSFNQRNLFWSAAAYFQVAVTESALDSLRALVIIGYCYAALWMATMVAITYGEWPFARRIIASSAFFTVYLATPWLLIFVPLAGTFENANEALGYVYDWIGPVLFFMYLWWYGFTAILIFLGSENMRTKMRMCIVGLVMPFYCLVVFVFARTIGFSWYLCGRMGGSYRRTSKSSR